MLQLFMPGHSIGATVTILLLTLHFERFQAHAMRRESCRSHEGPYGRIARSQTTTAAAPASTCPTALSPR